MKDSEIIALYWSRSEDAISRTEEQYGRYCASIARQILNSPEDCEECLSDAYLRVWNSIPPNRPESLKAYVGKITRNLALDRVKANSAKKRGEAPLVLEELDIPSPRTAEGQMNAKLLAQAITDFLRTLPPIKRRIFVLRYWYFEPLSVIAEKTGWPESRIKGNLYRMRKKLAAHLDKEGFLQ